MSTVALVIASPNCFFCSLYDLQRVQHELMAYGTSIDTKILFFILYENRLLYTRGKT